MGDSILHGGFMKNIIGPEDKSTLSVNEEIELLKAINENDQLTTDREIEVISLSSYYLD